MLVILSFSIASLNLLQHSPSILCALSGVLKDHRPGPGWREVRAFLSTQELFGLGSLKASSSTALSRFALSLWPTSRRIPPKSLFTLKHGHARPAARLRGDCRRRAPHCASSGLFLERDDFSRRLDWTSGHRGRDVHAQGEFSLCLTDLSSSPITTETEPGACLFQWHSAVCEFSQQRPPRTCVMSLTSTCRR